MIFLANILELNGGTTFLVRTCEALAAQGEACAVLVLRPGGDAKLADELARHARIFHLGDFQRDRALILRNQLSAFAPIAWRALGDALAPYGTMLHAMGAFGLILAARLVAHCPTFRITVGVYHQNEFIYRGHRLFSNDVLSLFRRMPADNVLFFNEVSRDNYIRFHDRRDFRQSPMLPIGIRIAATPSDRHRNDGFRIVSVGNLEPFKTYNRLVIGLLPQLAARFPKVEYHIYGSGEEQDPLVAQARELGVLQRVIFHGRISYDRLQAVWDGSDLFVGSGTALIEAAAGGLPALIGIESMQQPLTYGFLCDIDGLSYNEYSPDIPLQSMEGCITGVFADAAVREKTAGACNRKAGDFSVARTARGLIEMGRRAMATPDLLSEVEAMRMLVQLPMLALRDRFAPDTAFARRRNQSFAG